jgi:hypothetical protein
VHTSHLESKWKKLTQPGKAKRFFEENHEKIQQELKDLDHDVDVIDKEEHLIKHKKPKISTNSTLKNEKAQNSSNTITQQDPEETKKSDEKNGADLYLAPWLITSTLKKIADGK